MDWLFHGFPILSALPLVAQTPPPPATPTADELELLKQQLAFLKDANASLAATFERYVKMVQLTLATAGGIVGIVAILGTVVSIKSLSDFYNTLKQVDGKVREAVDQEVALALKRDRRRISRLEALLAREDIPDRITLQYVIPASASPQRQPSLTLLLEVLQRRGFSPVLCHEPNFQTLEAARQQPPFTADIVVLDLLHAGIDRDIARANPTIQAIANKLPSDRAALIIYGSEQYSSVRDLINQGVYCGVSNGPLSFVARVLEAAYVVDAIKAA